MAFSSLPPPIEDGDGVDPDPIYSKDEDDPDKKGGEEKAESEAVANTKKKKQSKQMFDEEVDRFDTYEEYLDSLVSDDDHFYLEDEQMARVIAELGYRSSGDTLSRENFYKMKSRLAAKRLLTTRNPDEANREIQDDNTEKSSDWANDVVVKELKSRARHINGGELHTLIFMQTKRKTKAPGAEAGISNLSDISGHIDLTQRQRGENFLPFLTGSRRLIPRRGDLTFYDWAKGVATMQSSINFEVSIPAHDYLGKKEQSLTITHRASGARIGDVTEASGHASTTLNGFRLDGWKKTECRDVFGTVAFFFDIIKLQPNDVRT